MPSASAKEMPHQGVPGSVAAIAVLQLIGALPVIFLCGITLWGAAWVTHEIRTSPILAVVFGVPFCLAILSVVASVGLFRMKEWGRRASLWLVSLSTLSCALFLIFYHPQIRSGLRTSDDPYDISRPIAGILLVVFIFLSLCSWIVLTSDPADSPFRD